MMTEVTSHKQANLEIFDKINKVTRRVECDAQISTLIYSLNEIGAVTVFSCQDIDGKGTAMVGFRQRNAKSTLLHARTIVSAYYPDRIIYLSINDMFEPIIYAAKRQEDIETIIHTYKFDQKFGRECEFMQIQLMQKFKAIRKR